METKLKEILDRYEEQIDRYEKQVEELVIKMDLYKAHNFEEEFRITNMKYSAVYMAIYRWREMHKEFNDVYNAWMS
jgi:hypothetical protein